MERLTEQIVAWHNRHPLAKRISAFDVHTVGVVALPFMRQNRRPPLPVEPVLSEEVDPLHDAETRDALAEAGEDEEGANEPGAFSRFETETAPRALRGPAWLQTLQNQWFKLHRQRWGNHWQWPVFSEDMIPGLSPARTARFALDYGYNEAPGDPHWPRRTAAVDEAYVAKGSAKHHGGAWPFELYLVSAGIDAGSSRTRVLIGQGMGRSLMLTGRRCISPVRSAIAALLVLGGLAWAGWSWLHPAGEAAVPAQAASAPAPVPSAPASTPAPVAAPAMVASAPASAPEAAASAPASAVMNNAGGAVPASAPARPAQRPATRYPAAPGRGQSPARCPALAFLAGGQRPGFCGGIHAGQGGVRPGNGNHGRDESRRQGRSQARTQSRAGRTAAEQQARGAGRSSQRQSRRCRGLSGPHEGHAQGRDPRA